MFSVSKPNPLDQFFDSSNFEIFDSMKGGDKEEGNLGGNRVFEIEIIGPYQLVSSCFVMKRVLNIQIINSENTNLIKSLFAFWDFINKT